MGRRGGWGRAGGGRGNKVLVMRSPVRGRSGGGVGGWQVMVAVGARQVKAGRGGETPRPLHSGGALAGVVGGASGQG